MSEDSCLSTRIELMREQPAGAANCFTISIRELQRASEDRQNGSHIVF